MNNSVLLNLSSNYQQREIGNPEVSYHLLLSVVDTPVRFGNVTGTGRFLAGSRYRRSAGNQEGYVAGSGRLRGCVVPDQWPLPEKLLAQFQIRNHSSIEVGWQ